MAKVSLHEITSLISEGKISQAQKILGSIPPEKIPKKAQIKMAVLYARVEMKEEAYNLFSQASLDLDASGRREELQKALQHVKTWTEEDERFQNLLKPSSTEAPFQVTEDLLRDSAFLFPLSSESLQCVIQHGKHRVQKAGEKMSSDHPNGLGFWNLVLQGKLQVEREKGKTGKAIDEITSGYVFGPVDHFLGVGEFSYAQPITTCHIFSLSSSAFEQLLKESSEFKARFQALQTTQKIPSNANPASTTPPPKETTQDPSNSVDETRQVPRYNIENSLVQADLGAGQPAAIRDISSTGIFIEAPPPLDVSSQISFTLVSSLPGIPPKMVLKGTIARRLETGMGIQLDLRDEFSRKNWEQIVTQISSTELPEILGQELIACDPPLSVNVLVDDVYSSGSITSLCEVGATLKNTSLPENATEGTITLRLIYPDKSREMFDVSCHISRGTNKEFNLQFSSIHPRHKLAIQKYLSSQEEKETPPLATPSSKAPETIKKTLSLKSPAEFSQIYLRDIKHNILILPKDVRFQKDMVVNVRLEIARAGLSLSKRPTSIALRGRIERITANHKAVLALETIPAGLRNRMKSLISSATTAESTVIPKATPADKGTQLFWTIVLLLGIGFSYWWVTHPTEVITQEEERPRTVEEAFKTKFLSNIPMEEKTIHATKDGTPIDFSTKDLLFVRFDPRKMEHRLFVSKNLVFVLDQALARQLPPEVQKVIIELDPSAVSWILPQEHTSSNESPSSL